MLNSHIQNNIKLFLYIYINIVLSFFNISFLSSLCVYILVYIEVTFYYFEYVSITLLFELLNIDIAKKALITQGLVHASICSTIYNESYQVHI